MGEGCGQDSRVGAGHKSSDGPRLPVDRVVIDIYTYDHEIFLEKRYAYTLTSSEVIMTSSPEGYPGPTALHPVCS